MNNGFGERALSGMVGAMTPAQAAEALRTRCLDISRLITAMHGEARLLENPPLQGEIFRALFELTKNVEVIKKHLLRLQKGDNSTVV